LLLHRRYRLPCDQRAISQRGRAPQPSRIGIVALAALNGAHVDWPGFKGLNEREHKALDLAEERNQLG
jgi:hypothetical protein